MADGYPLFRSGPQVQGLRYRFEKAGILVEEQPIPWSADAVLIDSLVLLPSAFASRTSADFPFLVDGAATPYLPESIQPQPRGGLKLQYRLPVPRQTTMGELFYRHRSLGQLALPVLTAAEFTRRFHIETPILCAIVGDATVACQTVVGTQCQGLIATALIRSTQFSLLPLLDLGMSVEVSGPRSERSSIAVHFASQQIAGKQTLLSVALPRPRRLGEWQVRWRLADRVIAEHSLRSISKPVFLRSLRVSGTRFVVQSQGAISLTTTLPRRGSNVERAGPCFLVESQLPAVAGQATLRIRARVEGAVQPPLLDERDFLISDGPNPIVPGTLKWDDLDQIDTFELHSARGILAKLALKIPTASINSEGGFDAAEDFTWNDAAEEELWQKLAGLGKGKA